MAPLDDIVAGMTPLDKIVWSDEMLASFVKAARFSLMYKIVHNLVLIEAVTYGKLQRNLIKLQQILLHNKYYEMTSFFPHTVIQSFFPLYTTVKDWNSLPKTLLAADSLKAFKTSVVNVDHHLPY